MERKSMYAVGKFRRQQIIDLSMPDDAAPAGKTGRNYGEPEMRIRCRATVHMAFVQHFQKRRLEFQLQFVFKDSLHAIWHRVHRAALYTKIELADRTSSTWSRFFMGTNPVMALSASLRQT